MNEKKFNLEHRQQEELDAVHRQRQDNSGLEFGSAEEALRHDAAHVQVPAAVADRLAESVRNEPPAGPWWRKLFK